MLYYGHVQTKHTVALGNSCIALHIIIELRLIPLRENWSAVFSMQVRTCKVETCH
jgi:hypothetical protein